MTPARTIALLFALVQHPSGAYPRLARYADAIRAATTDRRMRAVLAVVSVRETDADPASATPPLGLVNWTEEHGHAPTVEEGARIAVESLRYIRRVRCPGAPLSQVLGYWHHGRRGPHRGCWADRFSELEMHDVWRVMR